MFKAGREAGSAASVPARGSADPPLDNAALLRGLQQREQAAMAELFDCHAPYVRRVLARILGVSTELPDVLQEVFVRAIESAHRMRDASALPQWLTGIAVMTARIHLQRRHRQRWLRFLDPREVPERAGAAADPEGAEGVRSVLAILDRLPTDERIAFALRVLDGMELTEVATASGVSLSTVKRRLARAERAFVALASESPVLRAWLARGTRWGNL